MTRYLLLLEPKYGKWFYEVHWTEAGQDIRANSVRSDLGFASEEEAREAAHRKAKEILGEDAVEESN